MSALISRAVCQTIKEKKKKRRADNATEVARLTSGTPTTTRTSDGHDRIRWSRPAGDSSVQPTCKFCTSDPGNRMNKVIEKGGGVSTHHIYHHDTPLSDLSNHEVD